MTEDWTLDKQIWDLEGKYKTWKQYIKAKDVKLFLKKLKWIIEHPPVTENNKPFKEKEVALILTSYKKLVLDKINSLVGKGLCEEKT